MMISSFEDIKTLAELFSMLDKSNRKDEEKEMVNIAFNSSRENRKRMSKGVKARQDLINCGVGYSGRLIVCLGSYMAKHPEMKDRFNSAVPVKGYPVTIEFNTNTLEIQVYNNVKAYETAFVDMEKQFREYNVAALVEQIAESFGCDLHICTAERVERPVDEADNKHCTACDNNCGQCGNEKEVSGMEALFGSSSDDEDDYIDDEDTDNCEECCSCDDCRECCSCEDDCCGCDDDCCDDCCCEDECDCNDDFDDYTLGELKELAAYGEQYLAEKEEAADNVEDVEACDITEYDRAIKLIKEASEKLFNIEIADREAELIYTVLFNSKQISDNLYK